MKTNVEINIPKDRIDAVLNKRIKTLERQNKKLKKEIGKLKLELKENEAIFNQAKEIIEAVKLAGDLKSYDD